MDGYDGLLEKLGIDGFMERLSDGVNILLPSDDSLRPGQVAAQAGVKAHHPIVIIPGNTHTRDHRQLPMFSFQADLL
jgi:hypothetical protein